MKIRPMMTSIASALFALAVPAIAQTPTPAPAANPAPATAAPAANAATENLFYKAFWLEKGERDKAKAMVLYEQFLNEAPEHPLAKQAATFQFELLTNTGKAKEAEAFAKKYEKLLGNVAVGAPAAGDAPAAGGAGRGPGAAGGQGQGGRRGQRGGAGAGGNPQERIAELKKQIDEAKAAGDESKQKQLEQELERVERMAQGGPGAGAGAGGQGAGGQGQGGRRGGMFGQPVEFAKMTKEQLDEFKTQRLERMTGMIERMRENGQEDRAKQMEEGITAVKKALGDNKLDDAQKAWDKMTAGMRRGGGGGR